MIKIAKIGRIFTIPPIINLFILIFSYYMTGLFHGTFAILIIVTCLFPLLSYYLSNKICKDKENKRDLERSLSTKFCIIGYVVGFIILLIMYRPKTEIFLVLTYLLSGIIIYFSFLLNKKPSGHAAGVAGPIVYMLFTATEYWLAIVIGGSLILMLVFFSSLYLKRHTLLQLIIGCLIPSLILTIFFVFF